MSRNRVLYNVQGAYFGPAPATGFHFVDRLGSLNDNWNDLANINLVYPLHRTQSVSYDFNVSRSDIQALGKRGYINRPIINAPTVNLQIDCLQMGVINELRAGFYCNYMQVEPGLSGQALYSNNFSISLISGFVDRNLTRPTTTLGVPFSYRDKRNIFVAVNRPEEDLNEQQMGSVTNRASGTNVVSFGNCYIVGYRASAAVGTFPITSYSYLCENMALTYSGKGELIPAVNSQTQLQDTTKHFNIPSLDEGSLHVSTLLPGDITVDISSSTRATEINAVKGTGVYGSTYSTIYNLEGSATDIKITSYDISLNLDREPLSALGYKLPLDREIAFPVVADVGFSMVIGEHETGALQNLVSRNDDYDIVIKLRNPPTAPIQGVGVRYDIKKAKLTSLSFSSSIQQHKVANMSFATELDPDDLTKGLFISGLLNIDYSGTYGYLLQEDDFYLLQEDGFRIGLESAQTIF